MRNMTNIPAAKNRAFESILEQHVENASFLWVLHRSALSQPHYSPDDLRQLQDRLDKNIQGLTLENEDCWPLCMAALELEGPGEVFISAIIAFSAENHTNIQAVIDVALTSDENVSAIVSALTWLPKKTTLFWVNKFLLSKNQDHKYLALEACSALGKPPGDYLKTIFSRPECLQHDKLIGCALRMIGELKQYSYATTLKDAIGSKNPEHAFWASWSTALLGPKQDGYHESIEYLCTTALTPGPHQETSINIVFRRLSNPDAHALIKKLAKTNQQRAVIHALSALGDPQAIPWLLELMPQTLWARSSAEAYANILGIDLEQDQLSSEAPENLLSGPSDDPSDDNIDMDEDENLPWPNVDKLHEEWNKNAHLFEKGTPYFMGARPAPQALKKVINDGRQRQRHAAALTLATVEANEVLINTMTRVK